MDSKVIVITGAGGVLCGNFAKELAKDGHKVALLDINIDAAEKLAAEIRENGGEAIAIKTNVLEKESLENAHNEVLNAFGKCQVLINGAGGNNPRGTTTNEYFNPEDIDKEDLPKQDQTLELKFSMNFVQAK